MQARSLLTAGWALGLALVLGSCGETMSSGSGFQSKYAVARNALEAGDYERARKAYLKLISQAGPLTPRLQLEYAHAELRAGNFSEAASAASNLAQSQSGTARGAALAVQGTAQHELGLILLSQDQTAAGKAQLVAAQKALSEVLKSHADLDPLGGMAGRKASIAARLKAL
ncbi:hypothetical protein [Pseudophaeobacter sp.]|jgi:hypothetical protein|uniref:Tetratricopeptide repeat-containing protein n=1 Tax=Pseudophaeobacter arcticus TaxID=385492 RepID=A0ABQ0AQ34_9RHOB|nr:hypothetical protein [uncultured Pseudophaeobacter sp.]UWS81787.1 hypothetical protein N1037_21470 [Phaeobacter sp. G2]